MVQKAIRPESEQESFKMWLIKTRAARGLDRKHLEYVLTSPNSKVTYGPFSSEVKAKEQAHKLNQPAPATQSPTNP
jgi:hypothetical protein